MYAKILFSSLFLGCIACQHRPTSVSGVEKTIFQLLKPESTGINFENNLTYDRDFNIYKYRNFYNGGGVAIGDVNNDGRQDIFFTANQTANKLYLNLGDWKFEDITERAGVAGRGSWSTGVAMADINGDGWLDIYVCNSGNPRSTEDKNNFSRANECYINNGNATFTERAAEMGIADRGLGTHAAFFDYDRDGDLDLYMLNNSFRPIGSFNLDKNLRHLRDSLGGDKLYQNQLAQTGKALFKDVSSEAGILGSEIAFGLGVTVGDVNHDGWQDLYISNDFFEKDYFYINLGNGKFEERLEKSFPHISAASMGADMADINNDAYPEIFVTDMLPDDDYRLKTATSFDSYDRFQYTKRVGYYHQFTRNMLHLNNADGTFSDIACLAGTYGTDWSWGALLFDMDNDGWKDIFVANGIAQDLTNQDYLAFISDPTVQREIISNRGVDWKRLIDSIPSQKLPNFAFQNLGNWQFSNQAKNWGLAQPSFSNGAAYADLDNDGDLDLVVNNVNMPAFIYQNRSDKLLKNNYLKFEIAGEGYNSGGLGAKIFIRQAGMTYYQEVMPMRGFQSSVDPRPNFGVGKAEVVDTVLVQFLSGKTVLLTRVGVNQTIKIEEKKATAAPFVLPWLVPTRKFDFHPYTEENALSFRHQENDFTDFDRDRMLFFKYSTEGPRTAVADVNADGREDIFFCGAAGQPAALFFQQKNGSFKASQQPAFVRDAGSEDVDAAFFDADNDGDPDLYVASGGNEMMPGQPELADRLYLNDGKGRFAKKIDALPGQKPFATGCIAPADFDNDGDTDVFVGMRLLPGNVGTPVGGFLMLNDGKAYFSPSRQPALQQLGMITDAQWADFDADGDLDLAVVGEWMPVTIFKNEATQLHKTSDAGSLHATAGLWKRLAVGDLNGDGLPDLLLGNVGINTRLKATPQQPMSLIAKDFDVNGTTEIFLSRYTDGKLLPYNLRGEVVANLPFLKKKFLHFRNYAGKSVQEIFTPEQLQDVVALQAGELHSAVAINSGGGRFQFRPLPIAAQLTPMYAICLSDLDADGDLDALCGGNFTGNKPEMGYWDSDFGLILENDGSGNFTPHRAAQTGFRCWGEVRDICPVRWNDKTVYLVARNNDVPLFFSQTREH